MIRGTSGQTGSWESSCPVKKHDFNESESSFCAKKHRFIFFQEIKKMKIDLRYLRRGVANIGTSLSAPAPILGKGGSLGPLLGGGIELLVWLFKGLDVWLWNGGSIWLLVRGKIWLLNGWDIWLLMEDSTWLEVVTKNICPLSGGSIWSLVDKSI